MVASELPTTTADFVGMMENEILKNIHNNSSGSDRRHLPDHTETGASAGYVGGNELKSWGQLTAAEIYKNKQKFCQHCVYRSRNKSYVYCDYFLITEQLRRCSPINCEKFKADARKNKITKPIVVSVDKQ